MSIHARRADSTGGVITEAAFAAADPGAVVSSLDAESIHLWRLPYRRAQGRKPLQGLLAAYLRVDTDAVRLRDDQYGKPRLIENPRPDFPAPGFSWSHGGELALVALARGVEPGVDVEQLRPRRRALVLARRFFAREEAALLAAFPEAAQEAAFLRLWCTKEAVLKALGRGIAFGLERVAFTPDGSNWRPARFAAEAGAAATWQVRPLTPAPGYLGALAWRGSPRKVLAWRPLASD